MCIDTCVIHTYGNGEVLYNLFTGINYLFYHDNSLIMLAKAAGFASLLYFGISIGFLRKPFDATWFFMYLMIFWGIYVPQVRVDIEDHQSLTDPHIHVDHIPLGVAAVASWSSKIGYYLTSKFETAFRSASTTQLTSLNFTRSGVAAGPMLLANLEQLGSAGDIRVRQNISNYVDACVLSALQRKTITWDQIAHSASLFQLFSNPSIAVPGLRVEYTFPEVDGARAVSEWRTCAKAWSGGAASIQKDLSIGNDGSKFGLGLSKAIAFLGFGPKITGGTNQAIDVVSVVAGMKASQQFMEETVKGLARVSDDAVSIMRQQIMLNITRTAMRRAAGQSESHSMASAMAETQLTMSTVTNWKVMGHMALKTLPLIRNVIEALIIGSFPFLFVIFLLPNGGKAIIAYLQNMLWLQLWAPLYAILNMITVVQSANKTAAAAFDPVSSGIGSGGSMDWALNMMTTPQISSINADIANIAGYMAMSIPLIAYGLLKGGEHAFTQLAGSFGQSMGMMSQQFSSQASQGNINMGTVGYNTLTANKFNDIREHHSGGSIITDGNTMARLTKDGQGRTTYEVPSNDIGVNVQVGRAVTDALQSSEEKSLEAAMQHAKSYSDGKSHVHAELDQFLKSQGQDFAFEDSTSGGQVAAYNKSLSDMQGMNAQVAAKLGVSVQDADQAATLIRAGASADAVLAVLTAGTVSGGVETSGGHVSNETFMKGFDDAKGLVNSHDFLQARTDLDQATQQLITKYTDSGGVSLDHGISDQWARTQQAQRSMEAKFSEAHGFAQSVQHINERSVSFDREMSGDYVAYLENEGRAYVGEYGSVAGLSRATLAGDDHAGRLVNDSLQAFAEQYAQHEGERIRAQMQSGFDTETTGEAWQASSERVSSEYQERGAAVDARSRSIRNPAAESPLAAYQGAGGFLYDQIKAMVGAAVEQNTGKLNQIQDEIQDGIAKQTALAESFRLKVEQQIADGKEAAEGVLPPTVTNVAAQLFTDTRTHEQFRDQIYPTQRRILEDPSSLQDWMASLTEEQRNLMLASGFSSAKYMSASEKSEAYAYPLNPGRGGLHWNTMKLLMSNPPEKFDEILRYDSLESSVFSQEATLIGEVNRIDRTLEAARQPGSGIAPDSPDIRELELVKADLEKNVAVMSEYAEAVRGRWNAAVKSGNVPAPVPQPVLGSPGLPDVLTGGVSEPPPSIPSNDASSSSEKPRK